MRRVVYSTAVGCGWLLGAASAHAAQWSVQPTFSWSADEDSNRAYALADQAQSSEAAALATSWLFRRTVESSDLSVSANADVHRYTDSSEYANAQEGTLTAAFTHTGAQTQFSWNVSAGYLSTLTSEIYQTGIVKGNLHRLSLQTNASFSWSRTELHEFFIQAGFGDTSYHGALNQVLADYYGYTLSELLPGFRSESAALGERFFLSAQSSLTVSLFGDRVYTTSSPPPGANRLLLGTSYEAGAQLEYTSRLSERLHLDVTAGESRRSVDGAPSNYGTNASVSLTRDLTTGHLALAYSRSLLPYGIGSLVEVQQSRLSLDHGLGMYLTADCSLFDIDNKTAAGLVIRRRFEGASAGFNWQTSETWTLRTEVSAGWTDLPGAPTNLSIHEWRGALTMTWHPQQSIASR
jgi:hypothetical protein